MRAVVTTAPRSERHPHSRKPAPERRHGPPPSAEAAPIQCKCACGGGCPTCVEGDEEAVQPKLTVNEPGDEFEREADAAADAVMRAPEPVVPVAPAPVPAMVQRLSEVAEELEDQEELEESIQLQSKTFAPGVIPVPQWSIVQRQAMAGGSVTEEEELPLQSKSEPNSSPQSDDAIEPALRRTRGAGDSLSPATRAFMESRFGVDFGPVKIHTDALADALSRNLHAFAFTTGFDIYFSAGQYRPGTPDGDHLLAHELAHVVQQNGANPPQSTHVQRIGDEETKTYFGKWAHKEIEDRLIGVNDNLIVEAPIPGGTSSRFGEDALNSVGFADLYKGDDRVVSGIRGIYKDGVLTYQNMPTPATSKALFSHWKGLRGNRGYQHGPRFKSGRTLDTSPDFPANFWIGEIKPLFPSDFRTLEHAGSGTVQVGNYIEGFKAFVERAYRDKVGTGVSTTNGKVLPELKIPSEIDYREFAKEHTTAERGKAIGIYDKGRMTERVWVYSFNNGLYVYFLVPHPYTLSTYPRRVDEQLKRFDPVLKALRQRHPTIRSSLGPKRRPEHQKNLTVQRKQKHPVAEKWNKAYDAWKQDRLEWVTGAKQKPGAKEFLETEAKGPVKRQQVDEALGIPPEDRPATSAGLEKKLATVRFWADEKGAIFGYLRFRFGSAFDRITDFFDRMRTKLKDIRDKSGKLSGNITPGGWEKTAMKLIVKIAGQLLKESVALLYSKFAACVNGMIGKVTDRFTDQVSDELAEELEGVHDKVEEFKDKLEEEYTPLVAQVSGFIDKVEEFKQWAEILIWVERAIRLGVQVVACGTPPALGCLWGLVAQIGIEASLELLTSTQFFEDEIAMPSARKIMDSLAGDAFQNLVADTVDALELREYAEGVDSCARRNIARGGLPGLDSTFGADFDPNSAAVKKVREKWEKKYHDVMISELKQKLRREGDEPGIRTVPTEEEIMDLVRQMQISGKTPEEILASLRAARNEDGTIGYDAFRASIAGVGTAAEGAGGEVGEGGEGKVVDAENAKEVPDSEPEQLYPDWRVFIVPQKGHTKGDKVFVTVDVKHNDEYQFSLINVPAEVRARHYWPSKDDKQGYRITYVFTKRIRMDPYAPHLWVRKNDPTDAILRWNKKK